MKMSDYPRFFDKPLLKVEIDDYVATLTLDCPENLNKINEQFVDEFHRTIVELRYDDAVRAIVIRSSHPEVFIAGGDMDKLIMNRLCENELIARQFMREGEAAIREMRQCEKPIIACVDGQVIGGGVGYTLACDMVLATSRSSFLVHFAPACGMVPDCGGLYQMVELMGRSKTMHYTLRGCAISAEEAEREGLLALRFDDADAMYEEAYRIAAQIAAYSPYGIQAIKTLCAHAEHMDFDTYSAFESESIASTCHTEDLKEFLRARAERLSGREDVDPPHYVGY